MEVNISKSITQMKKCPSTKLFIILLNILPLHFNIQFQELCLVAFRNARLLRSLKKVTFLPFLNSNSTLLVLLLSNNATLKFRLNLGHFSSRLKENAWVVWTHSSSKLTLYIEHLAYQLFATSCLLQFEPLHAFGHLE